MWSVCGFVSFGGGVMEGDAGVIYRWLGGRVMCEGVRGCVMLDEYMHWIGK